MLSVLSGSVFLSTAFANLNFTDVETIPSWSTTAIESLIEQNIIGGNSDGTFAPHRPLNRAEVTKILVLTTKVPVKKYQKKIFPDVKEEEWFADYVQTAYEAGWVKGYPDGLFRPQNLISRAEMAKIVTNAFRIGGDLPKKSHFTDVSPQDWFFQYVEVAYAEQIMWGDQEMNFLPAKNISRAKATKIVYDAQKLIARKENLSIKPPSEGQQIETNIFDQEDFPSLSEGLKAVVLTEFKTELDEEVEKRTQAVKQKETRWAEEKEALEKRIKYLEEQLQARDAIFKTTNSQLSKKSSAFNQAQETLRNLEEAIKQSREALDGQN